MRKRVGVSEEMATIDDGNSYLRLSYLKEVCGSSMEDLI
jgi:hypothetical protein